MKNIPLADTPNTERQTSCGGQLFSGTFRPTQCLYLSILFGISFSLLAEIIGFLPTGHKINDPIFFSLAPSSLIRGSFLYFPWAGLTHAFLYAVGFGLIVAFTAKLITYKTSITFFTDDLRLVTQTSYVLSVVPVLAQELGSFQVILSYGLAIWLGVLVSRLGPKIVEKTIK